MPTPERQLKMLVLPDGTCPFQDWFEHLADHRAAARIEARLTRLEAGNPGDSKSEGRC